VGISRSPGPGDQPRYPARVFKEAAKPGVLARIMTNFSLEPLGERDFVIEPVGESEAVKAEVEAAA
jgi:3-hydroxyacyl-CoA dehydrogenase